MVTATFNLQKAFDVPPEEQLESASNPDTVVDEPQDDTDYVRFGASQKSE